MTFTKDNRGYVKPVLPITKEQHEKILKLWTSQFDFNSIPFIAKAVGISEKQLSAYVKEGALPKRKRPWERYSK